MTKRIFSIARKELKTYFGSPMAAIFIGTFLLSVLFSFFWLETFFARNIADIRPLFQWMPLLMIFLVAALTMRQWSEEQRMGTMEVLLTMPVKLSELVIGKFIAVLALVAVALLLTIGLPITVSLMGNLDWGPVIGGYLGALLLASAYIAIGLFVSARTDNQIIALILSVLIGGFFYLLGSPDITSFMGNTSAEIFRALGTGSRFASIERGVIDLRDLVYYGSLTVFFLVLNIYALDRQRWSYGAMTASLRRNTTLTVILVAANLLALNLWLAKTNTFRLDLTENKEYSISPVTRDILAGLQEPLILRGYFSEKTHPLLAPLVPRIKDMLTEYGIAGKGKVKVSFVDPKYDEEAEIEANQQYGIKPVPFQVAGRYEASVVNSYFNILVKYGDQYVTLGFNDLIEVEQGKNGQLEVQLRNLEYDLTKSIKKVVYGFQSVASIFASRSEPVQIVALLTPNQLPESVAEVPERIRKVIDALKKEADGKLHYEEINPNEQGLSEAQIKKQYGVEPLAASLLSPDTFYMHLLMKTADGYERIYLGGDFSEAEIRKEVEAVLKRNSSGFLKTVGFWTPQKQIPPQLAMYQQQPADHYTLFRQVLRENYNLEQVDLSSGRVSADVDVLLLVAPQNMTDTERLAVDQFMMQGGSVIALTGSYGLDLTPSSKTLEVKKLTGGIGELLAHYGVTRQPSMVMDMQNEPFPIPVERDLGGIVVREIRRMDYPFFVDVRRDGMNSTSPVTASLPAVTMNYASPLTLEPDKIKGLKVTRLLTSSPQSWLSQTVNVEPDFEHYPDSGFATGSDMKPELLAVALQGSFSSYFKDKPDPRAVALRRQKEEGKDQKTDGKVEESPSAKEKKLPPEPVITESPDSTRLVVVGSSEFINDTVLGISRSLGQERYLNNLEFLHNIVDWSVEDQDLLTIRSRGTNARLLEPLSREQQAFWEWLNYAIALASLLLISGYGAWRRRHEKPMPLV
ncbi:MAG: Gldg family protein [Deltaproteobacteria bacterium]